MSKLPIDGWMVAWQPDIHGDSSPEPGKAAPGSVEVGPWPDTTGWSTKYQSTSGACYSDRRHSDLTAQVALLFVDFNTLVVRDGIDPQRAHTEFLKIQDYCERISPDTPGAL